MAVRLNKVNVSDDIKRKLGVSVEDILTPEPTLTESDTIVLDTSAVVSDPEYYNKPEIEFNPNVDSWFLDNSFIGSVGSIIKERFRKDMSLGFLLDSVGDQLALKGYEEVFVDLKQAQSDFSKILDIWQTHKYCKELDIPENIALEILHREVDKKFGNALTDRARDTKKEQHTHMILNEIVDALGHMASRKSNG